MTPDERAQARCREHEGRYVVGERHMPYRCPAGHWTIGYGHLVGGDIALKAYSDQGGLSEQEAQSLFRSDWDRTRGRIEHLLEDRGLADLDGPRRGVLVEMAFQLGVNGCRRFRRMWKWLERREYAAAADEMRDSKWRSDTRRRCDRLAFIMETGNDA